MILYTKLRERSRTYLSCLLLLWMCCRSALADGIHQYVFFNRDRERIHDTAFLSTQAFEGAQLKYTWRELEPEKDGYDFSSIRQDLTFLQAQGKRLFVQIQDASFDVNIRPFPRYLLDDPAYHGGADHQIGDGNVPDGWVARRWDKAVQERFQRLLMAIGREFDGRIEGINLAETAIDMASTKRLWPKGFTPEAYCDAVITNMAALKRAFPKSVTLQYANFMPGDKRYLERVFQKAQEFKVGLGGPDNLPYKPYQMENSYPLIRRCAGRVPTGIAVQDGNYEYQSRKTGRLVTIDELLGFAKYYLKVRYLFWCTQEPFYSGKLIPFLNAGREQRHTKAVLRRPADRDTSACSEVTDIASSLSCFLYCAARTTPTINEEVAQWKRERSIGRLFISCLRSIAPS